jgi:hypothetical protein
VTIIFLISSCLSGVIPLNGNDGQTAEKLRIVLDERLERSSSGQNERDTAGIHRILQRIRHLLEIPFRRVVHYVLHFIEVNGELAHLLDTIEGQWSPMMILVMSISLKSCTGRGVSGAARYVAVLGVGRLSHNKGCGQQVRARESCRTNGPSRSAALIQRFRVLRTWAARSGEAFTKRETNVPRSWERFRRGSGNIVNEMIGMCRTGWAAQCFSRTPVSGTALVH